MDDPSAGQVRGPGQPAHRGKDYNDQLQLKLGIAGRVMTRGGGER